MSRRFCSYKVAGIERGWRNFQSIVVALDCCLFLIKINRRERKKKRAERERERERRGGGAGQSRVAGKDLVEFDHERNINQSGFYIILCYFPRPQLRIQNR